MIYQTNLWICECCGIHMSTVELVDAYTDRLVAPAESDRDWGIVKDTDGEELLACPDCLDKEYGRQRAV